MHEMYHFRFSNTYAAQVGNFLSRLVDHIVETCLALVPGLLDSVLGAPGQIVHLHRVQRRYTAN